MTVIYILGHRNPLVSELHLWRRDLNCHRCKSSSWQTRGFEGCPVRGRILKMGERTSPTLPQTASTLVETQSTMMSEIKVWICSQIGALPRWMGGGRGALYGEPRKFCLKVLKNCSTWTPSRIMLNRTTQTSGCEFPQLWNIEDCWNEVDAKILGWGEPQPYQEKDGGQRRGRFPGLYHRKEHKWKMSAKPR